VKLGIIYLALGVALVTLGFTPGARALPGWVALSAGAAFGLLGLAYLRSWPGLLGKRQSGRMLVSSYVVFWPYHAVCYLSLLAARFFRTDPPMNEIIPGLWQGGRLLPWDKTPAIGRGFVGVLDLTAEFSEIPFLRRAAGYGCIPMLDRSGPTPAQLDAGVRFITEGLRRGPVYVHCALGYGRSSVFTLGYLLKSGNCSSLSEARSLLRTKRRRARLNREQLRALKRWYDRRDI
jgi:hypothetical protein